MTAVVLLGRDHRDYGNVRVVSLAGGRTAVALSVGADPFAPSLLSKGDPAFPNEDALLARDDGDRVLLAVADAHYGLAASHDLLAALAERLGSVPQTRGDLDDVLRTLRSPSWLPDDPSATTFLVAVLDRGTGRGFGLSYGDSSCVGVRAGGAAERLNEHDRRFVTLASPGTLWGGGSRGFAFEAPPGGLLLGFTDGVDGCHYGSPATSVGLRDLGALFGEVGAAPEAYARRLAALALAGVGGHPGGQDNVALVVTAT